VVFEPAAGQPVAAEPAADQTISPQPAVAQSAVTHQSAVTGASPVVRQTGATAASPFASQPHSSQPSADQARSSEEKPGNAPPSRPARPVVTVTGDLAAERPLRVVERALRSQPGQRPDGWRDRVVVVPGGHRPGKPDQLQRDRARARLQVDGSRRIVVLGCTRGAGQTTTTLLAGDTLASLRGEPVAVLDLNPGRGSLTEQAAAIPGLMQDSPDLGRLTDAGRPGTGQPSTGQDAAFPGHGLAPGDWPLAAPVAADAQRSDTGLQVISGSGSAHSGDDAGRLFDLVAARYRLTFADPAAGCVPRTLDVADQLLIVAPASAEAANALAMTFEWLEAHGHGRLAAAAITVLNGVSGPTRSHVEHAAAVASGRCRAIVKVPWDSHLKDISRGRGAATRNLAEDARGPDSPAVLTPADPPGIGLLSPALMHAYTALAGVLIAGLAQPGELRSAGG
jgi:MinD-like ATPase involved in chromosome partitioning or flagellar assembly